MAPHPPLSVADTEQQNTSSSSSTASSSGGSSSSPPPAPAPLPLTAIVPSAPFDPLAPPSTSTAALAIATAIPLPQQQLFQQYQHQLYQQQRLLSLHLSSASSPPGTGGGPGGPLPLKNLSLPPPTALRSDPAPASASAPSAAGAASDRHSRDDCWSESATLTLIQAWGYRYLDLNRGNLKQKHWKDVADSVNSCANGSKAPKTDIQCKNRLDTLKKKYKLEKSKIITGGGPSKWTFFDRLDELIGPSKKPKKPTPVKLHSSPPPVPTPLLAITGKRLLDETEQKPQPQPQPQPQPLPPPPILNNVSAPAANHFTPNHVGSAAEAASTSKGSHDTTDSCPNGGAADGKGLKRKRLHDNPMKLLARAIIKFGEVYERIETAKQQQMIELEKQRMKFTKDLELQRLQLFMQTQVELAKLKRNSKHCNTEHYL